MQLIKFSREEVFSPSFHYNTPLHSLLEIPTRSEVILQKLPPQPCKFLNSLQRKQSFALRSSETACTLSSLLTVCPARPPSPVALKGHHHPQSVPTGTFRAATICILAESPAVVNAMEKVALVTRLIVKAHKSE